MHRLLQKRNIIIICLVAVMCCVTAKATANYTTMAALPNVLQEVLAPAQKAVMTSWQELNSFFGYFRQIKTVKKENEELKAQIRELTWDNNNLREYVYENRRLLQLLDFKEHYESYFTFLGAKVAGRSPNTWSNSLIIDRGSEDGIKLNQIVVSDEGLVGRIVSVNTHCSQVLLIIDRESAVGAMVKDDRTVGVVEGSESEQYLLRIIHLPYNAELAKGQMVITSGFGGIFPRGIPIGEVVKMESEGGGFNKYALVDPFVDFNRLEEVLVITDVQELPNIDEN